MDTALSLENNISYRYQNPGDNKGYIDQVLRDREMHFINRKCYEFILHDMPYIIFQNRIYSFDQGLGLDCSSGNCVPDTTGLNETVLYILPLNKILK